MTTPELPVAFVSMVSVKITFVMEFELTFGISALFIAMMSVVYFKFTLVMELEMAFRISTVIIAMIITMACAITKI